MNHLKDAFYLEGINRVQDYIENHLDESLTVRELSKIAAFSEFHFHRIYHCFTGESLYTFIKRLRLDKAAFLLLSDAARSITDIALSVGFANQASFAKAFRQKFGISASEYRRKKGLFQNGEILKDYRPEQVEILNPVSVKVLDESALNLIYLRYTGRYREDTDLFSNLFQRLYAWASQRKLISENSRWFVIYHDMGAETDEEQLRLSVCMSVSGNVAVEGEIGCLTLPGGIFGVGSFWVNPREYGRAWYYMYTQWLPESGYKPDDRFALEHYPPAEPAGERRLVEIYIPVVRGRENKL